MGTTTLAQTSLLNYPGKSGNSEEQDEPPNNRGQKQKPGQPSLSLMTRPARWVDQGSGPVDREESGSIRSSQRGCLYNPRRCSLAGAGLIYQLHRGAGPPGPAEPELLLKTWHLSGNDRVPVVIRPISAMINPYRS